MSTETPASTSDRPADSSEMLTKRDACGDTLVPLLWSYARLFDEGDRAGRMFADAATRIEQLERVVEAARIMQVAGLRGQSERAFLTELAVYDANAG